MGLSNCGFGLAVFACRTSFEEPSITAEASGGDNKVGMVKPETETEAKAPER